nr:hypothetical protein [Candidatus Freyarchaeota archaeon]
MSCKVFDWDSVLRRDSLLTYMCRRLRYRSSDSVFEADGFRVVGILPRGSTVACPLCGRQYVLTFDVVRIEWRERRIDGITAKEPSVPPCCECYRDWLNHDWDAIMKRRHGGGKS